MKTWKMSLAASLAYKPPNPDRTAKRSSANSLDFDVTFQEWPNRTAMLKTIDMQERGPSHWSHWRAIRQADS